MKYTSCKTVVIFKGLIPNKPNVSTKTEVRKVLIKPGSCLKIYDFSYRNDFAIDKVQSRIERVNIHCLYLDTRALEVQ